MTLGLLVLAPESSGTRLLTRLLIACGCAGSDGHEQPFDGGLPYAADTPIVWRRSFPHAGQWSDVAELASALRKAGYTAHALTLRRDFYALRRSQVSAGHVPTLAASDAHIRQAEWRILTGLAEGGLLDDYLPLSFGQLTRHPAETMAFLVAQLGLPRAPDDAALASVYDADARHYEAVAEAAN